MNNYELTQEEKDALKRLELMGEYDIVDMNDKLLWKLACGFRFPSVIRAMVEKGHNKRWKENILNRLKDNYRHGYLTLPFEDVLFYDELGNNSQTTWYFDDIAYDIATNQPIVPIEEKKEENLTSDTPEDIQAELEELREQVRQFRDKEKGTALGLNQAQAALFGLALANTFSFNYTNKKKDLAPLLHKLFGWGESKLAAYLSTPCEKEERDELANLFKDLCPPLYATIMNRGELPPGVTPKDTP